MLCIDFSRSHGQRGAVLITGLVILVVMTIIGLASMQGTVLEERVAGNLRDRSIAFEAAEAGLQAGLAFLEAQTSPPVAQETTGLVRLGCSVSEATAKACSPKGTEQWLLGVDDEGAIQGIAYTSVPGVTVNALAGVARQPLLVIEERYTPPLDPDKAAIGAGIHYYTVTSLGFGQTEQARVLLQSTIAKAYSW